MKRWIGAALSLAAALAAAPAIAAPVSSVVAMHGRLGVAGNRVIDAHGQPVSLHGVSLFWSQWMPAFYNPRATDWIARDWHATAVRAAIAAANGGYTSEPAIETKRAETVIDAAIAAGIYVVVDWHAHDPLPDEAARFFTHIAHKYRGVPNLIYETWNEPDRKYGWSEVIKPYHLKVIAAIRAEDPGAFVVAGTRSWDQDVDEAAADPINLPNVAYGLHFYAATHKQAYRDKADLALKRGAALFVTEYGTTAANGDAPVDVAETRIWWAWCDARGISYLNWSISDKDEASAALRPGATPTGGWPASMLTASGTLVRDQLLGKAPAP
ncbi:MAG: glycoside hydrolase family 5 protein [Sphingomonas sp.]